MTLCKRRTTNEIDIQYFSESHFPSSINRNLFGHESLHRCAGFVRPIECQNRDRTLLLMQELALPQAERAGISGILSTPVSLYRRGVIARASSNDQSPLDTYNWLAGILIAKEAGAQISTADGRPWRWGEHSLFVATPGVLERFLERKIPAQTQLPLVARAASGE